MVAFRSGARTLCAAAAFTFGVAACGGSDHSLWADEGGDGEDGAGAVAAAPDAPTADDDTYVPGRDDAEPSGTGDGAEEEGDEASEPGGMVGEQPQEPGDDGAEPAPKPPMQPLLVMSYNVRKPLDADTGAYSWSRRRAAVVARILANNADLVGVQEASNGAQDYLLEQLTGEGKPYAAFKPSSAGSPKLVFYRKARFQRDAAIGHGNDALPNPYASSHSCHANAKGRRAAWVGLQDKPSGVSFLVVNAHFAHAAACSAGRIAQAKHVKQLLQGPGSALPKIVMGDFNADPQTASTRGEKTIAIIEEAGVTRAVKYEGSTTKARATFNSGWKGAWSGSARLDYIFSSATFKPASSRIDRASYTDSRSNKTITPSDHYAVLTRFTL